MDDQIPATRSGAQFITQIPPNHSQWCYSIDSEHGLIIYAVPNDGMSPPKMYMDGKWEEVRYNG